MPQHIEVIVRGLLLVGNRVLLCRNRRGGFVYLPGGHAEFGETAKDALVREFVEETGVRPKVGPLLAVSEGAFTQKGKVHHEVNLVFHVEPTAKLLQVQSLEPKIEFVWMTTAQVRRADLRPRSARKLILAPRDAPLFSSDFIRPKVDPARRR